MLEKYTARRSNLRSAFQCVLSDLTGGLNFQTKSSASFCGVGFVRGYLPVGMGKVSAVNSVLLVVFCRVSAHTAATGGVSAGCQSQSAGHPGSHAETSSSSSVPAAAGCLAQTQTGGRHVSAETSSASLTRRDATQTGRETSWHAETRCVLWNIKFRKFRTTTKGSNTK